MAFSSYKLGSPTLQVLIPIYNNFNTLDANGPIEVLSAANRNNKSPGPPPFKLTIAATTEVTTSVEGVQMVRNISLNDAIQQLSQWDILILPGGVAQTILSMIATWKELGGKNVPENEIMTLLDRYLERKDGFTLTVCTGSLFLGALGKLAGRTATSHWASLKQLKSLCTELSDGKPSTTKIVRARWIDSPEIESLGVPRLITSGGVSCGIDATYHLLDLTVGSTLAEIAATRLDYQRRGEELQEDYVID